MDTVWQEIGINIQHVCETNVPGRYQLICDKAWLRTLERRRKISTFTSWPYLDRRAHPSGPLEHPWTRILVHTYRKQPHGKVFPLPRTGCAGSEEYAMLPLTYSQAVAYVANTNFKQLWESAYKQYTGAHLKLYRTNSNSIAANKLLHSPTQDNGLVPHDIALKELIYRIYNCPVIHCKLDRWRDSLYSNPEFNNVTTPVTTNECNANVLPALVTIETSTHFCIFHYPPSLECSLYDSITYSPAVLGKSYNKSLFVIYQIFQLSKSLQAQGLFLGDLRLQHLLLNENLWLQILPALECNMLSLNCDTSIYNEAADLEDATDAEDGIIDDNSPCSTKFDLKFAYDPAQFTLREYTEMWCNGQISNFDYLTILNNAVGRTMHDPAYHHIMPWVTDFSARNGANWRDLTKSKYRLNKGDVQLDLMYQAHQQQTQQSASDMTLQVPHHVSDFLSEITYFVYMARRTPQKILCEHVRPIWVPAEYPATIQRLQEWTPDECIPEFYSDALIFKSIHEDLPDLELPAWATCPEDFIYKHREALESQHVSERLHHWIDLNFGYKLSGKAAIKAKNVCLSTVDQHRVLAQRGIVQLFTQPHPPKRFPSIWFSKCAPRLNQLYNRVNGRSPNSKQHKKLNQETRRLAKSTEQLQICADVNNTQANASPRMSLHPMPDDKTNSNANFYTTTNFIELPKDYNPAALLQNLESMQSFFSRTFPKQQVSANPAEKMHNSDLMFEDNSEEHSFTNQLFADESMNGVGLGSVARKSKNQLTAPAIRRTLKQQLGEKRERELQVLGCLIVEIFAMQRLRPLLNGSGLHISFAQRLHACRTVVEMYRQDLPKCLRYIARVLLQLECTEEIGLPTPNSAQLLEPIFATTLVPFPSHYYAVYTLVRTLHAFDFNAHLLELHTHFNCNGKECSKYTEIDRTRVLYARKIAECKVMACCAHIRRLLEPMAYEQFSPVELLLPHIIDLLCDEQTSILTAWYLFDAVAQALGIAQTQQLLLLPIMKLYDVESFERGMTSVRSARSIDTSCTGSSGMRGTLVGQLRYSTSSSFKSRKSVKLYHHSFLLRLIVRFGLRCFLQHFIAPLIEAVGGYKEPEDGNGLHYHSNNNADSRRTSKNLSFAVDNVVNAAYSEIQAECGAEQEVTVNAKPEIEDVFSFDDDINSDRVSNGGTAENKSIDSFDMRTCSATTVAEEAKEAYEQVGYTPENQIAITDIIYGTKLSNTSIDDPDKISLRSQNTQESPQSNDAAHMGPKSPTIEIPTPTFRRSFQLNTIDCEIGSRKSVDSFEIITQAVEEATHKQRNEMADSNEGATNKSGTTATRQSSNQHETVASDTLQASVISKMSEAKALQNNRISEMSAESLVWLSHRLGPVLTSRYITRNLLKMLTLCYVGQENLLPESCDLEQERSSLNYFSIADARVVGDRSAARVLECLMSIAALFGEEFLLLQYFPYISELIVLSAKRITSSLEGAIISSLQLLKYMVPCLMDATLMEHLKNIILDAILLPLLQLLGSDDLFMPNGYLGRSLLARKLLDAVYVLCVRIGPEMSKDHLCQPLLTPFFLLFDKAFAQTPSSLTATQIRACEELRDVFTPALAHTAYLTFLRFLGENIMQRTLSNLEFVLTLCHEFEQPNYKTEAVASSKVSAVAATGDSVDCPSSYAFATQNTQCEDIANSFGSQIVGNRIEVAAVAPPSKQGYDTLEVLDMVTYKFEQLPTTRHLKGNWLAYWRHELARNEKDTTLNLKQIRLQSFVGHTNSVRAILALDNENSFISASKDKTVKLWSLRSEGDGKKTKSCQFTYTAHKKAIYSLSFLESLRYVVSCDSGVHIWDPFIGRPLCMLDSPRHNPITVVKCLPSPSPLIVAGTAESTVKIIDARSMQYVNEWRLTNATNFNATVRCLTVAPSGNWLAAGLSSGGIVMLDTRMGVVMKALPALECDLLQLTAPNDQQLVSSALDHSLAVWHVQDGVLHYQLRPPAEPAHFLQTFGNQLVFATTGNRIGVYADISSSHAAYNVTKLRSETFRGVLTSLAVLPLNRAFLAGNESGNIALLC